MNKDTTKDRQIFQMLKNGLESIAKAILSSKEMQKVELVGIDVVTLKGAKPTDEELVELIKPLIPQFRQPDDGHTPTDEELLVLIKPLIPEVKNGETPSDEKLLSLIKPLIPKPQEVEMGKIVEEASNLAAEEVKKLIPQEKTMEELADGLGQVKKEWLPMDAIIDFGPRITRIIREFGGGNTRPLDVLVNGVNYGGVREINLIGDGVTAETVDGILTVTFESEGGGNANVVTPGGNVNSNRTVFTVASQPKLVFSDGMTRVEGFGYSYNAGAGTITMDIAPQDFIRAIL